MWNEIAKIREDGYILSTEYETGHNYDIKIKVEEDQLKWLHRLREQYFAEYKSRSRFFKPSSANDTEHSMARNNQLFVFKELDHPEITIIIPVLFVSRGTPM